MKPHKIGEGRLTGMLYLIGFPSTRAIYIGSSTQPGATRFRQHILRLKGRRHPNSALQAAFDESDGQYTIHALALVYGATKTELMNYEWSLSIRLHSEYTVLSDDPTKSVKHYLEPEDEETVIAIVNKLMELGL